MAADLRGWWRQKREDLALQQQQPSKLPFMIPSPVEDKALSSALRKKRPQERSNVPMGFKVGLNAALWACVFTTIPTLAAVRFVPWAKANINYTGQALIISSGTFSFGNPETMQHKTVVSRNAAPPDVIPNSQDAAHSASSVDSRYYTWTIVLGVIGVVIAAIAVVMQVVTVGHNQYLQQRRDEKNKKRDEKDKTRREEEETARRDLEKWQEVAANLRHGEVIQWLAEFKEVFSNRGPKTQEDGLQFHSRNLDRFFTNNPKIAPGDESASPSEPKEPV